MRSRNCIPLPRYLLAMLTTRRRLASESLFLAAISPFAILFANSVSSSDERRGTLPISLRYILTGSSIAMLSDESGESISSPTLPEAIEESSASLRIMSSRVSTISMPLVSRVS